MNSPDIMNMMNNPEMMSKVNDIMKNPEMMAQVNEMMKNPEMMANIMGMMNNSNETKTDNIPEQEQLYQINSIIKTKELKKDNYNNQTGKIIDYNKKNNRYIIHLDNFDNNISIKEENIEILKE